MSPKRLATLAAVLGLGVMSLTANAHAQSPYRSPAKWNNFHPVSDRIESIATPTAQQAAERAREIADELIAPVQNLPAPRYESTPRYETAADSSSFDSPMMREYESSSMSQSIPAPVQPVPMQHSHPSSGYGGTGYSYAAPSPSHDSSCAPCQSGNGSSYSASPYASAMSSPWEGQAYSSYGGASCAAPTHAAVRPALFPYFGSANVLLFTLEESSNRDIATGLGSDFTSAAVDPGFATGFDVMGGRYFGCGRYGLGIGYFNWNPGNETVIRQGTAGGIRATMPQYRDVDLNYGSGPDSIYDHVDGTSVDSLGATAVRVQRDVQFQGIEANLFSFGLMGAGRVAYAGCDNGSVLGRLGLGLGRGRGFGGAVGPLARSNSGRVRVMTSHGFRWFQIQDDMELAYNVDGAPGYGAEDIYDSVEVENNLFGYQFGGRLTYCLGSRLDLNIGGKFGLYGNHAEMRHELGTETQVAYRTGAATDLIRTEASDTVLASLGELDLGLGFRVNNAWTIRGGYRMLGVTGVATAPDAFPANYSSVASAAAVHADGSYLLHGGYVGLDFNW